MGPSTWLQALNQPQLKVALALHLDSAVLNFEASCQQLSGLSGSPHRSRVSPFCDHHAPAHQASKLLHHIPAIVLRQWLKNRIIIPLTIRRPAAANFCLPACYTCAPRRQAHKPAASIALPFLTLFSFQLSSLLFLLILSLLSFCSRTARVGLLEPSTISSIGSCLKTAHYGTRG